MAPCINVMIRTTSLYNFTYTPLGFIVKHLSGQELDQITFLPCSNEPHYRCESTRYCDIVQQLMCVKSFSLI